ncbi:MAG: tetratricopeptide repeat protein [Acidobacteriota bacterium]
MRDRRGVSQNSDLLENQIIKASSGAGGTKAGKRKPSKEDPKGLSPLLVDPQLLVIIGLILIVFLCYANSLWNEFVFDDIYLVRENPMIRNINMWLLNSYRPLRDISYAVDFALWGADPFGFRLTNIVIHAGNVLLVFALIRRLTQDFVSATITALIFAVHPIQTDAVAYISGRRDLLFSFFYLLSFHSYITYFRSRWSPRAVICFFLFVVFWGLSLLAKEMAVTLPIVIFVWHYCDAWEDGPSRWRTAMQAARKAFNREKWSWIVFSAAGIAFTWYWVSFRSASRRASLDKLEYWGGSFYRNFLTVIRVHAWYLKQLVYPTPIAQYLGVFEISETLFDWRFLLSLALVGGLLVYGFLVLNRDRLMAFAIFSYFVFLIPVSQIIPHHELLADHYLYLPMMSFGLFVSLLVRRITSSGVVASKVPYIAVAAAVLILAVMTVIQNKTWKDERTLWAANYKVVPNSPRAAINLGNTYQYTDPARAEELFKRALQLNPTPEIKRTLNDRLAVILIQQNKYDEAEFFVVEVLNKAPKDFFGNLWLSQIHIFRKECGKAREALALAQSVVSKPREENLAQQTKRQLEQQCGN